LIAVYLEAVLILTWYGLGLACGILAIPLSRRHEYFAQVLGFSSCAVGAVTCLIVIPNACTQPFRIASLSVGLASLPLLLGWISVALANRRIRTNQLQASCFTCVRCGYSLIGLTKPRCPECGTPFPEALLTSDRAANSRPTPDNDPA